MTGYIKRAIARFDIDLIEVSIGSVTMNEHEMQGVLTAQWQHNGPTINNQKLFLAAWEVMTADWRMNKWGVRWSPSVDFWFLDEIGRCWLLEFKPTLVNKATSWSALCQVTHRSVLFARTFSLARLEGIYTECNMTSPRSTKHQTPLPLCEAHAEYFGLQNPLDMTAIGVSPFQRVIAAQTLGDKFWQAATAFDGHTHSEVMELLNQTGLKVNFEKLREERTRFATLGEWGSLLTSSISGFETGLLSA